MVIILCALYIILRTVQENPVANDNLEATTNCGRSDRKLYKLNLKQFEFHGLRGTKLLFQCTCWCTCYQAETVRSG